MRLALVLLIALSLTGLTGCGNKAGKDAAAVVNGKAITLTMIDEKIENLPEQLKVFASQRKRDILDEMIIEQLIYEEAKKRNIDHDSEVRELIDEAVKKIIISRMVDDEIRKTDPVSEDDIKAYYEENRQRYMDPDLVRASHILTSTEEEAKLAMAALQASGDFEEVARTYSNDLTKDRGGDLGYFKRGQMIPEFEKVVFNLKAGEVSDIVKSRFGYHIIKLLEYKPAAYRDYDEVKDSIADLLTSERQEARFKEFTESLKAKADIEVNEDIIGSGQIEGSGPLGNKPESGE